MVQEGSEVLFGGIAVVKEVALGMIPDNFKKAVNFAWAGLMGMGNWMGYILASIFFLGEEFGFGTEVCEAFGYGYWLIDQLYVVVNFIPKPDSSGGKSNDKLASAAAKEAAAKTALANATASKAKLEEE